ncbi:MAG: hydrogenase iron-sulfur subunit [Magnetococcales bacterium]|nr:hydrogenase iron-sulfur subunit [Magnetococcales bacterium]
MKIFRTLCNGIILWMEGLLNIIFGNRSNPLYHLGSLTFYFFWVVLVSGIYIFIFFDTSVTGAYSSVAYMTNDQWWLAGVMRSVHRYASDAAVVTIFLHLFREFGRDRYRGVRWFSWFTGVPTLWLVVMLGITGYWLVWDMLAQYVAIATAEMSDWLPVIPSAMIFNFLPGQVTDRFFTLMAFLHLLGLPVALVFLLWTHVSRISKVDFMPPRDLTIGTTVALLILSLVKPAVSHAPANLSQSPLVLNLDWFYLNIYPVVDRLGPGWAWGLSLGTTLLLLLLPWLPPRREAPPASVMVEHCTGCGGCARDCPFGAATMRPRTDGRDKQFESTVDPSLCTACGICVGSCSASNPFRLAGEALKVGIHMPGLSLDLLRQKTDQAMAGLSGKGRLMVFGCDHGVTPTVHDVSRIGVVRLPCTGMLPPSFLDYVLKKGADGVMVTGCRQGDCYHRLGDFLTEERIAGNREPRLVKRTDRGRIRFFWEAEGKGRALDAQLEAFHKELVARDKDVDHA